MFIPLKVMYPAAEVPAVAMSWQIGLDPILHCGLGAALAPLRDEGVLIAGAEMSHHNLRDFAAQAPASFAFHGWVDTALANTRDVCTRYLAQWHRASGGQASHPREEHLMPLMVASGAGSDLPGRVIWRGAVGPTRLGGLGIRLTENAQVPAVARATSPSACLPAKGGQNPPQSGHR